MGEFENIYRKIDFTSHVIAHSNSLIAIVDAIIKNNWECLHQFHDNMAVEGHNLQKDFSIINSYGELLI